MLIGAAVRDELVARAELITVVVAAVIVATRVWSCLTDAVGRLTFTVKVVAPAVSALPAMMVVAGKFV